VPHDRGFIAHSDGDVALHALTDAILGAVALGDIGRWFPPSDPQWKGASSDRFLAHAVAQAASLGFRPVNLDVTILCERPKIGPHAEAMRARIAAICTIDPARVSVKATTTEGLGFTGRGEGIAAQAAAVLQGVPR
jgi:2-C-methyl-D-erythritol 4-phosphate cytidylyltransferase/2-C-methyl-D-erythritol 2,4-cyclodiphosphate synthase